MPRISGISSSSTSARGQDRAASNKPGISWVPVVSSTTTTSSCGRSRRKREAAGASYWATISSTRRRRLGKTTRWLHARTGAQPGVEPRWSRSARILAGTMQSLYDYKPNQLSVMNYFYTYTNWAPGRPLDYSRSAQRSGRTGRIGLAMRLTGSPPAAAHRACVTGRSFTRIPCSATPGWPPRTPKGHSTGTGMASSITRLLRLTSTMFPMSPSRHEPR